MTEPDTMQKIKIFKAIETESASLENEVNQWLAENDVRVLNMFGNISPQSDSGKQSPGLSNSLFAPSDIMLIIHYEH